MGLAEHEPAGCRHIIDKVKLSEREAAEHGAFRRLGRDAGALLAKIFGPRHLSWKAGTAGLLLLCAILVLVPVNYRVASKTVIEGEVQRVVAAPFEGFVGAAYGRAGDTVKAGQLLAQLDDRELRIGEARWSSERDQFENRLREAMANHDLTAMQVLGAQLRQASAQLALVTARRRDRGVGRLEPAGRRAGRNRQKAVRDRSLAELPHHPAGR